MKRVLTAGVIAAATATAALTATTTSVAAATLVTTAPISVNQFITVTEVLLPGDSAEFTFTNIDSIEIDVSDIALSGTGSNGGIDLGIVEFGLTSATTSLFTTIIPSGGTASATGSLSLGGRSLLTGDSFTIFWDDGIVAPVGLSASFSTTDPAATTTAPIPLPAAGLMLIGALGALGVVRRRRTSPDAV